MAKKKKQISEEEQKRRQLNRQINFLVMRTMWQRFRGRAEKGSDGQTIYAAFRMSRERYTRIINGETVRFSQEELKMLMQRTSMRREIFEGEVCFCFDAVSRKDWEKLFELRESDIKKSKTFEKNIYEQIRDTDIDLVKNPDLFYFSSFAKSRKPTKDIEFEENLKKGVIWLNSINIAQLEKCDLSNIISFVKALESRYDMARTLSHYIELKG